MTISVSSQAHIFLCAVVGGMIIGFIYDIFRIKRRTVRTRIIATNMEDLVYWLIVTLVMFIIVYYSNDGEIRGYIFAGTILGVTLYVVALSRIVMKLFLTAIKIISKILKIIWTIATYPIRLLARILRRPCKWLLRLAGKGVRGAGRIGKSRLQKVAGLKRVLKNIRKKI
ncbi:spore cortex biosynthesis protein YabQ [Anaerobacterium chartisolvens]|uniref:Spore cortex biosynthesis protein YabQ n=1 Tax=Anaerobacterium chartisolvens TaxID=1297424 RepID=A0A369B8L4_9FIRM|nr:spore cortex biosynthesis protein YabQ [Anaerobacterium chartisolvens]RCX17869.1 spore cortex biosynthesis protein YabQ [Anaerobacterium chartisolvens]